MTQQTAPKHSASIVQVLINITGDDGKTHSEFVDLDLDLSNPSLQESVVWEEELGEDAMQQLLNGQMKIDTPKKVRIFLYARLKHQLGDRYPNLQITDFDMDYDTLSSVLP